MAPFEIWGLVDYYKLVKISLSHLNSCYYVFHIRLGLEHSLNAYEYFIKQSCMDYLNVH